MVSLEHPPFLHLLYLASLLKTYFVLHILAVDFNHVWVLITPPPPPPTSDLRGSLPTYLHHGHGWSAEEEDREEDDDEGGGDEDVTLLALKL